MSNFSPLHRNRVMFLNDEDCRQVVHNDICSIDNMTDRELREAIIDDILGATMWEKEFKENPYFTLSEFTRFIPRYKQQRVYNMLHHSEIKDLIVQTRNKGMIELRIRDQQEILQAAMDYCGVWYDGFKIPDEEGIVRINHDVISEAIENHGSLENLATALAMDFQAQQSGQEISKTKN